MLRASALQLVSGRLVSRDCQGFFKFHRQSPGLLSNRCVRVHLAQHVHTTSLVRHRLQCNAASVIGCQRPCIAGASVASQDGMHCLQGWRHTCAGWAGVQQQQAAPAAAPRHQNGVSGGCCVSSHKNPRARGVGADGADRRQAGLQIGAAGHRGSQQIC